MNNFRNPYVDPDSFQSKVYDYYRSSTNPTHLSINNQDETEQKETQQSRKNKQYGKTKKHAIYTNHQLEKVNDSKLVMFSPPMVDSVQQPLKENSIDEFAFEMAQSKKIENEKMDKKEIVSNLVKQFSLMLEDTDDTSSMNEGFATLPESEFDNDSLINSSESTSIPENNLGNEYINDLYYKNVTENHGTMEDEFFTMFSESDELQEEMQNSNKNEADFDALEESTDTIVDKFFTMLSESDELEEEKQDGNMTVEDNEAFDENTDTMVDKFITMLSESDELEEEKRDGNRNPKEDEAFDENTDTLVDKFFTMLSESDKLQEEKHDSSFSNLKDTKSDEVEDLAKGKLPSCHKKPSFEKKRKYCINKSKSNNIACLKEVDEKWLFQKNPHLIDLVEKKKTTTVKMPVLLTRLETDVDIVESTDLLMPLDNILKVEWSVQSLDCKVVLPSETVFLKGEFIAEVEFSNKGLENKIQSLKITIPWKKTENFHWLSAPDIPYSNQREFMFESGQEHDSNYHYEAYQKFAEPIQSQLKQVHFVWHQELNPTEKQLQVNGVAQLSILIMQDQFIELDCYSE